jgi:hypothetical protein
MYIKKYVYVTRAHTHTHAHHTHTHTHTHTHNTLYYLQDLTFPFPPPLFFTFSAGADRRGQLCTGLIN